MFATEGSMLEANNLRELYFHFRKRQNSSDLLLQTHVKEKVFLK